MATIKSIEEKVKRYDEALEKLRRLHDNYDTVSTLINVKEELENIFPELKESEDERIRNRLINYLKVDLEEHPAREKRINEMLTWLEKQGEKKPVVDDKDAEKASEEYRNFRMSCGIKDPVMLNEIEEAFYEGAIRKQKLAEWSEEDEYCRHQLIAFCENCIAQDACSKRCSNWLKSLRPQNTWKPSDEQMKVLNEILYFSANHESPHWNDYIFGTLNNLIRQLKTLIEQSYESKRSTKEMYDLVSRNI